MGRTFFTVVAFWAILGAIATTPIGAGVGLVLAMGLVLLAALVTPPLVQATLVVIAGSFGVAALILAGAGGRAWARRAHDRAFGLWSVAVSVIALPMLVVLCMRALGQGAAL